MFLNLKSVLLTNRGKKSTQIVTVKVDGFFALLADQQMLMSLSMGQIGITALLLMHALDEMQFFEFFERTIDGHQAELGIKFTPQVVDFGGRQGAWALGNNFNNSAARVGDAVALSTEFGKPIFCGHF